MSGQLAILAEFIGEGAALLGQLESQLNQLVTEFPEHGVFAIRVIQVVQNPGDPLFLVIVWQLN